MAKTKPACELPYPFDIALTAAIEALGAASEGHERCPPCYTRHLGERGGRVRVRRLEDRVSPRSQKTLARRSHAGPAGRQPDGCGDRDGVVATRPARSAATPTAGRASCRRARKRRSSSGGGRVGEGALLPWTRVVEREDVNRSYATYPTEGARRGASSRLKRGATARRRRAGGPSRRDRRAVLILHEPSLARGRPRGPSACNVMPIRGGALVNEESLAPGEHPRLDRQRLARCDWRSAP